MARGETSMARGALMATGFLLLVASALTGILLVASAASGRESMVYRLIRNGRLHRQDNTTAQNEPHEPTFKADIFSFMLSLCPIGIMASTRSISTTRNIFPAKAVICNFGAAAMWAVYMNFQMYLSYGYSGLDAVVANCVSMAFNVFVLGLYFTNNKEYIKFGLGLVLSVVLAGGFTGLIIFHPYHGTLSNKSIKRLTYWSTVCAMFGIGLFAVLNALPLKDLLKMTRGDQSDIVTLRWPMLLCTFFNCFVSFMWTLYAWIFSTSVPNYFLIANLIAAVLSLVQCFWLGVICLHHGKVEGQITDAEGFRSSLLMLAKRLDEMGSVPVNSASWKVTKKFKDFLEHVLLVTQSLSHIKLALTREKNSLQEKIVAASNRLNLLLDEATATADHANLIVASATNAANQGIAAADAARHRRRQALVINARQRAASAIAAYLEVPAHDEGIDAIPQLNQEHQFDIERAIRPQANGNAFFLSESLRREANIAIEHSSLQAIDVAKAASTESGARTAVFACDDLFNACDSSITALEAISTSITKSLDDAQQQEEGQIFRVHEANALQKARTLALQAAIRDASPTIKFLASRVRSSLQVINATIGETPVTLREALRQSHEQILVLKTSTDNLFFTTRLKRKLRRLICMREAGANYRRR